MIKSIENWPGSTCNHPNAIKAEWAKITPEMCQNMIEHYYKSGGTLDKCIAAKGDRFSKPKLSVATDDE